MDNENRNMEDFFKNRLNNVEENESGWNEPPEFIWDKAQPEFPNRKKKKKFLIMFWGALVLMALIGYNLMSTDENFDNVVVSPNTNIDNVIVQNENKRIQEVDKRNVEIIDKTISTSVSNDKNIKKSGINNELNNKGNESIPFKINSKKSTSKLIEDDLLQNENKTNNKKVLLTSLGINNTKEREVLNEMDLTSLNSESEIDVNEKVAENKDESVDLLPVLGLTINKEFDADIDTKSIILIKPQLKKKWKWAVGLSTMAFLVDEFVSEEDGGNNGTDIDLETRLKIETSYNNLNFGLERRLGKHWSLVSGINLTSHSLDFDLGFGFQYFSVLNGENLRLGMSEFSNSVAVNNEENVDLSVNVDQAIIIPEGAPVDFSIKFGVKSTLIEVPLQLQYRWEGRRFIFATGLGFSLNYLQGKLKTNSFELFYEGQRVNMFEETNNKLFQEFSWGVLSSASVKYKITKKINASIFLSVTPFESDLTRVGVGLNYRF